MKTKEFLSKYQCKHFPENKVHTLNMPLLQICCSKFYQKNFSDKLYVKNNISLPDNIKKAVKKRKAEYLAGRLVAQRALNLLGIKNFSLTSTNTGNPIWPSRIVGSISHSDSYAICIAGFKTSNLENIGIDIEKIITSKDAGIILDTIISSDEYNVVAKTNMDFSTAITLCFSIKESVYKSINCSYKEINDFLDIQIYSISDKYMEVNIDKINKLNKKLKIECIYEICENHVITYCLFYNR